LSRKFKKLKRTKTLIKPRKGGALKRLPYTASLIKTNSTGKLPLTSAAARPVGILIGLNTRKLRTSAHSGNSKQEKIQGVSPEW
jgi:hypothetical protein